MTQQPYDHSVTPLTDIEKVPDAHLWEIAKTNNQISQARPLIAEARRRARAGVATADIALSLGVYLAPPPVITSHTPDDLRAARGTAVTTCVVCGDDFEAVSPAASDASSRVAPTTDRHRD